MNFRNFIQIFCILLYLIYLTGCALKDNNPQKPINPVDKVKAFFVAVRNGDIGNVSNYLIEGGDVNAKNAQGKTALHEARNTQLSSVLIEAGADIDAKDNDGNTPLHNVLSSINYENNIVELVRVLIEGEADVNAGNNYQETPLFYATCFGGWQSSHNREVIVKMLLEEGADVDVTSSFHAFSQTGNTPLKCVEKRANHEELVKLLRDAKTSED